MAMQGTSTARLMGNMTEVSYASMSIEVAVVDNEVARLTATKFAL
jgi:hypothetical protein